MRVVIMRGLPGSGKTTAANKLMSFYKDTEIRIFSADGFRINDRGEYDFVGKPNAHRDCYAAFAVHLSENFKCPKSVVIVDNTNIRAYEIAPYLMLAQYYGCKVEFMRLVCPVELAIKRNTHAVPVEVMQSMSDNFEDIPKHWPEELKIAVLDRGEIRGVTRDE